MGRNKGTWLVYSILGLAIIGVITQLFTNTASFLMSILTMLAFSAAVFALIYFIFFRKRHTSNDAQKYKQAVKQSKTKYPSQQQKASANKSKQPNPLKMKKKSNKRSSHLRVIDGQKSKRKNRANY